MSFLEALGISEGLKSGLDVWKSLMPQEYYGLESGKAGATIEKIYFVICYYTSHDSITVPILSRTDPYPSNSSRHCGTIIVSESKHHQHVPATRAPYPPHMAYKPPYDKQQCRIPKALL